MKLTQKKSSKKVQKNDDQYSVLVNEYGMGIRQAFVKEEYEQMLTEWAGLTSEPKKILDLGCGDGLYTNFLKEKYSGGVQVTGIDISESMISAAREEYNGIDFRPESMDNMSLPSGKIDFVFSRFTVHYSLNLQVTMAEVGRVTKSGGIFFMKEVHPFYATFLKKSKDYEKKEMTTFKTQGENGVSVVHPTFTLQEYSQACSYAGWRLKNIYEYYGQDAGGEKIAPMRVPTSIVFILVKE